MPGTLNLGADETVVKTIKRFAAEGKLVAAICAAPSVLGENHILEGKKATCHPGFEEKLLGAQWLEQPVVVDGNVITSRGMGTSYCVCTRACQILHRRCHSRAYSTGTGILIQRSANNHIISIITKEVTHQPHGARPLFYACI